MIPIKEREFQTITFYHLAHKKEEGTYHCNEKCLDSSAPGKVPLLLTPEYSGINKGQRVPDRSKTAHRKPLVKCFLTMNNNNKSFSYISDFALELCSYSKHIYLGTSLAVQEVKILWFHCRWHEFDPLLGS